MTKKKCGRIKLHSRAKLGVPFDVRDEWSNGVSHFWEYYDAFANSNEGTLMEYLGNDGSKMLSSCQTKPHILTFLYY